MYWVQSERYPRYEVSSAGDIRNRITGRILKPGDNGTGYLYVNLYDDFGPHRVYVHRFVFEVLVNPPIGEVNHINGNKNDNALTNLEDISRSENIQHAYDTGLMHPTQRCNVRSVRIIETGEIFESAAACARAIGGRQSTIQKIVKGAAIQHMGYTYEYADKGEN